MRSLPDCVSGRFPRCSTQVGRCTTSTSRQIASKRVFAVTARLSLFFFALGSLRGGCRFVRACGSSFRPLVEPPPCRHQMNLARALAREFVRRQAPPLRIVILVHLVRFAHRDPQDICRRPLSAYTLKRNSAPIPPTSVNRLS